MEHDDIPLPGNLLKSLLFDSEAIGIVDVGSDEWVNAREVMDARIFELVEAVAGSAPYVEYSRVPAGFY
jgi:hypothetical protein